MNFLNNSNKNEKQTKNKDDDDIELTKEEIERLDKFHAETGNRFTDDEVYELMEKYKNDDEAILNELKEQLKERERGKEYDWQEIGKSN